MPDAVVDTIRWPEIPSGLDPVLTQYLRDLQFALESRLGATGTVCVNGDLQIGGYLVLLGPDRIKTFIEAD